MLVIRDSFPGIRSGLMEKKGAIKLTCGPKRPAFTTIRPLPPLVDFGWLPGVFFYTSKPKHKYETSVHSHIFQVNSYF